MIASELAGDVYGLTSLRANIEDAEHNTTRFLIMAREPIVPHPKSGPCMTSFVFRVRNVPAALYKALGGFATNGVNMTKLESYLVGGRFNAAQFYAEVEGHPDHHNVTPGAGGARLLLPRGAHPRDLPAAPLSPRTPRGGVTSASGRRSPPREWRFRVCLNSTTTLP